MLARGSAARGWEVRARFKTHSGAGMWTHSEPLTWSQARKLAEALGVGGALDAEVIESRTAKSVRELVESWEQSKDARKKRSATG